MSLKHFKYRLGRVSDDKFADRIFVVLGIILCLKIWGYFTLSENIAITRALKILIRVGMNVWVVLVIGMLKERGMVASFRYRNLLAPLFYGLYLFLGLSSLLWSTNPGYSLLQLVMTGEGFVFTLFFLKAFVILRHFFPHKNYRMSALFAPSIFMICAVFVIGMFTLPDEFYRLTHGGTEARLGGYFMNPNELGMLAAVGLACCFIELIEGANKKWQIFMIAVLLFALLKTGSRSSLIGFVLILGYFLQQSDQSKLKLLVVAGGIMAMPFILTTIVFKQGDVEEVLSMTGRLPFWKALLTEGLPKEPWFGFGFMRIAYTEAFQSVHTYAGKMTHNTFIQVLMNLGFVGFFIVVLQMAVTIRAFVLSQEKVSKLLFVGVFIPILINSFTEFGIFGETNYGILFYHFLIFLFVVEFNPQLNLKERVWLKKHGRLEVCQQIECGRS